MGSDQKILNNKIVTFRGIVGLSTEIKCDTGETASAMPVL